MNPDLPHARRLRPWIALLAFTLAACASSPSVDDKASAEALHAEARSDMASGNYERAIKSLERVEGRGAGTLLAQQAALDLAYAYWKSGERAQALSALDRFIKLHPSSPAFDYALYLKGLINFNEHLGFMSSVSQQDMTERDQQASRDAHQSFKQLTEQFPDSRYTPDARARMDYIVNALARYELHVARYYYRRGAFIAAANRAQQAVKDYQQTPSVEEALYILARSYERLGLNDLRDDADRVLAKNFPNSRFPSEGISRRNDAWWKFW
jgi:outer membrane protein assembly factor BamD